ncbi:MAG: cytochrome oxidase subunit III [Deltaproteobacteria bacterium]|nr:cytochrome oxidase subunit III [Deltaproteobacteria bacterium]MBW2077518.1 cytochrome oxidase subunit III [Deltaproteobacteria bacterium]MBW2310619.1 cytochrome oxidase subunit III [Deltaproteobacteria bacterium]
MRFNLWGWILFVVCALFFIASSLHGHDILGLVGSIIFLIACLVFIYPLVKKNDRDQDK